MTHARMDEDDFDPANLIRIGTVKTVDLAEALCVVTVGDIESPPVPWMEARMGKTRIWSPPSIGEQILLICADGELGGGVVLRGIPSDAFPPAASTLEELILFEDGARIAYDPEAHKLTAHLPAGSTIDVTADQVNITGNVAITGDIAIDGQATVTGKLTADDDVIGGGKSLKSHKHGGVQAGGAQTGAPV